MDDRGVARGKCIMPSCSCLQYERQGRVKRCTCGHVPTKHAVANQPDVVRDEDTDFDSQFEECISLDHTQPSSFPVSASVPSSDNELSVPQAWSMSSVTQSPTAGKHRSALLFRGTTRTCRMPTYTIQCDLYYIRIPMYCGAVRTYVQCNRLHQSESHCE